MVMGCPDCGADLDQVPADQRCPNCGSARRDVTISPSTVRAAVKISVSDAASAVDSVTAEVIDALSTQPGVQQLIETKAIPAGIATAPFRPAHTRWAGREPVSGGRRDFTGSPPPNPSFPQMEEIIHPCSSPPNSVTDRSWGMRLENGWKSLRNSESGGNSPYACRH
jgi:hypothetical protein